MAIYHVVATSKEKEIGRTHGWAVIRNGVRLYENYTSNAGAICDEVVTALQRYDEMLTADTNRQEQTQQTLRSMKTHIDAISMLLDEASS